MKLRLILRRSLDDNEGKCVDYAYFVKEIDIDTSFLPKWINQNNISYMPAIIGGEWLESEKK